MRRRIEVRDGGRLVPFLAAACFFLSAIEYMVPKPLPFMRLGISNLPLILGTGLLPLRSFLLLAALKVLGMNIVSGSLFSYIFLFSLAGTLPAALLMYGLRTTFPKAISLLGISLMGAMTSNLAQLAMARLFIFGKAALYVAPAFLAMGMVTGLAMGAFAESFAAKSRWYALVSGNEAR